MESNHEPRSDFEDLKDKMVERHRHCRRRFFFLPVLIPIFVLVKSAVVFYLWNYLIPDLFHGPVISYPQAIGLTILAKVLIGFGRPFGPWHRGHHHHHHLRERWMSLSPEDREKLKESLRAGK